MGNATIIKNRSDDDGNDNDDDDNDEVMMTMTLILRGYESLTTSY